MNQWHWNKYPNIDGGEITIKVGPYHILYKNKFQINQKFKLFLKIRKTFKK